MVSQSRSVGTIITHSGLSDEMVNRIGPKPTRNHVISFRQILYAVVGYTYASAWQTGSVTKQIKDLQLPDAIIPGDCASKLVQLVSMSSSNEELQKADLNIWRAIGILIGDGLNPSSLNVANANRVIEDTKRSKLGWTPSPIKKLGWILKALKGEMVTYA